MTATAPPFVIEWTQAGSGNSAHRTASLATSCVTIGPFRLSCDVLADGTVALPDELRDEVLRHQIAVALRFATATALQDDWARVTAREELLGTSAGRAAG